MKHRFVLIPLAASLGALFSGCQSDASAGYSFNSVYPDNVRSVSVPIFGNYTFSPGVEVDVTEAVIKELQRTTRYQIVGAGEADTTIQGTVTSTKLGKLSSDRTTGLVQEMSLELTIDFDWVDNRSGKIMVSRRGFSAVETFVPARTSGDRLEVGQTAAVQRLARDVVAELRGNW